MAWAAIGGAAVSVVGGYLASKHSKKGGASGGEVGAYDPYAKYRDAAATKLNALMEDPNSLQDLPEYKAAMQAADRQIAAQGYTGSGNALVAAANAGGTAYQQAFNNLAMLAGAGQNPAYAASAAANQSNYQQQQQGQMWGQIGNIVGQGIQGYQNSNSYIPEIPDSGYYSTPPTYSTTDISVPPVTFQ